MLLATILLMCPFPQSGNAVQAIAERPASASVESSDTDSAAKSLPASPHPKIKTDVEIAEATEAAAPNAAAAVTPATPPLALRPAQPVRNAENPTDRQKKIWYGLTLASSGAAAFDAWSTRRAITNGYGTEANPFLRPFAHSSVLYAATQVSPLVMDFIGRKMMSSRHNWMRRVWWLPQSAGMAMSVSAGVHNVRLGPAN